MLSFNSRTFAGYKQEFAKIRRENDKLVEAILNGVPGDALKDKSEYIIARSAELEELLANTEETPVLFHPNMANRYHEEVSDLIDSLGNPDHLEEAAGLFRALATIVSLFPEQMIKMILVAGACKRK